MAITIPTVFVVGAGASCELGFPDGKELLGRIAKALDLDPSRNRGSPEIWQACLRHHSKHNAHQDVQKYVEAGRRLRDAAKIAPSIDNAIDQNSGEEIVEFVGKLGISSEILKAERQSLISRDPFTKRKNPLGDEIDHWLYYLGQMLTNEVHRSNAKTMFDNVTIITFNYDRSIEYYLPHVISAAYGYDTLDAQMLVTNLKIHHVYGQVGHIPLLGSSHPGTEYGAEPHLNLDDIAKRIQTFTERRKPDQDLQQMHLALSNAERIVFLGFAFHKLNMELLKPFRGLMNKDVWSTSYKVPFASKDVYEQRVKGLFKPDQPRVAKIRMVDATCGEFMSDHFSVFTG